MANFSFLSKQYFGKILVVLLWKEETARFKGPSK